MDRKEKSLRSKSELQKVRLDEFRSRTAATPPAPPQQPDDTTPQDLEQQYNLLLKKKERLQFTLERLTLEANQKVSISCPFFTTDTIAEKPHATLPQL